jgi:ATP-dependent protease HslVU (ClpYQ) peptidase subunit
MTVIVGITDGTTVYIGGDRGASDEISIVSLYRSKVNINNNWVFGYAGSLGIGQLMEIIDMPSAEGKDPYKVLRTEVVSHMRNAIELYSVVDNEYSADFIIGTQGRLFELGTSDWSVAEVIETSIGSGSQFALGSLHTTKAFPAATPEFRINMALEAATTYSPYCQGEVDILNV